MYNNAKVLDVHGHVSAPNGGVAHWSMINISANYPIASPYESDAAAARFGLTEEAWAKSAGGHIQVMDVRNIDSQLIGPRPFMMWGWQAEHLLPNWTRFVNDNIAKQVSLYPDRFLGACQLPQNINAPDASHMLPELNRCVDELGFIATYISPDPTGQHAGPGLADAWWNPLYARLEEAQIPIIIHGTNTLDPRIGVVPHNYQLGFVAEQYWANMVYQHSDVFERFPGLKVVICHCGGALDRFIKTDPHLSQKDLSNNLYYDTCGHDLNFLEAAIKQRGVARLVFGTEAPGSGASIRPETGKPADDLVPVIDSFDFLTQQDKDDIIHNNVAKLFPKLGAL